MSSKKHSIEEKGQAAEEQTEVQKTEPDNAPARSRADEASGTTSSDLPPSGSTSPTEHTEFQRPEKEVAAQQLSLGKPHIEDYEVFEKLGAGTFGEVWRTAKALNSGVEVAIKVFAHGTGQQWQLLQAEVKQLAMLQSDPSIVQLIDVYADARPPYYVMAYMEQGCLARRLKERGPVPVKEALKLFRQAVEAMAYVHAKGIRHCDLKPGNVLLDVGDRVRIGDFGQAHLSSDVSPALGTFFYMAPEQADITEQIPDTRWDVYGLGAVLYTMLTGSPPRENPHIREKLANTAELDHRLRVYRQWVQQAPPPREHYRVRGMDKGLARLLDRCLDIDPARRFHDAGGILEGLARLEYRRRQRPLVIFSLMAPLLLFIVLGILAWAEGRKVMGQFRENQELAIMKSNSVSANMVSKIVDVLMDNKIEMVQRAARKPEVRQAILEQSRRAQLPDKLEYLGRNNFASWNITDEQGTYLYGYQFDLQRFPKELLNQDFSWRRWFNGQQNYFEKPSNQTRHACWWSVPGRTSILVTEPYVSVSYERNKEKRLLIGLSAPVYETNWASFAPAAVGSLANPWCDPFSVALAVSPENHKQLIGVFLGNISVHSLHDWLAKVDIPQGNAVLLNAHGHCVYHTELFSEHQPLERKKQLEEKIMPTLGKELHSYREFRELIHTNKPIDAEYRDPVLEDGRTRLASYAPIEKLEWGVVVQQDRDELLQPVKEVGDHLKGWACVMLITGCGLLFALWGWLLYTLHREEKLIHA